MNYLNTRHQPRDQNTNTSKEHFESALEVAMARPGVLLRCLGQLSGRLDPLTSRPWVRSERLGLLLAWATTECWMKSAQHGFDW